MRPRNSRYIPLSGGSPGPKRGDAGRAGTTAQRRLRRLAEQPRWGHRMPGAGAVTLEDQPGEAHAAGLLLSTAGDPMTGSGRAAK